MKSNFLVLFLAAVALLAGCSKKNETRIEATLSVNPSTPISFTAKATETFTVSVTTNQSEWKVESSQSWCKIKIIDNQFTVSANQNTSDNAPTPAVITVTAGDKNVMIDVTQEAEILKYPENETELKQAISKVWIFPESASYISLEFADDNTYTLLSKTPLSKTPKNDIYLLTSKYTISEDLRKLTLTDFGEISISSLSSEKTDIAITPTGGTTSTVKLEGQKFMAPQPSSDKKISKVKSISETDGDGSIEYSYNTDNKLSKVEFKFGPMSLGIPISYEKNKVWFEIDGTSIGEDGIFKITYTLNTAGLAHSSIIEHNGELIEKTYYTYNNQRQLISYRVTDKVGTFKEFCNAIWVNGNITSIYKEESHTCDDSYSEYEGGHREYHHDHNGDGKFDDNDIMTKEKYRRTYSYLDIVNKGGYMNLAASPDIFSYSDFFGMIGQWAGILGVGCKNVMSMHESGDGKLSYTFDNEGYPIRIDITYDEYPDDNWYFTQEYK